MKDIDNLQVEINDILCNIELEVFGIISYNEAPIDFNELTSKDINELNKDLTYILEQLKRVENVVTDIISRYKKTLGEV